MCLDNIGQSVGHDGTQIGTLSGFVFTLDPLGWLGLGHSGVHSAPSSRDVVVSHYGQQQCPIDSLMVKRLYLFLRVAPHVPQKLALGFLIEYFIVTDYYYMIFVVGPVYIRSESLLISYTHSSHSSFILGYICLLYSAPLLLVRAQLL